jgi:hypothetical protein
MYVCMYVCTNIIEATVDEATLEKGEIFPADLQPILCCKERFC